MRSLYVADKKTLKHSNAHSDLISTFKIQVQSTLAIKCQGDFRIFQFPSAVCLQKDSAETFVCYVDNGFSIALHFAKGYDLVL